MRENKVKKIIIFLYIFFLITSAVIRFFRGDQLGSTVFLCVVCFILLLKFLRSQKKNKYLQKYGLVLFDERDIDLAGQAALFTIRVQLGITGLLVLGIFAFNPASDIPVLVLSLYMAFSALLLQITYRVFRNIK